MSMKFSERDLVIERLRRSGPGGQHRNKRDTGIRLTHLPTGIVVMATEERSQSQNLEHAMQRLEERLIRLYTKPKPRKKTKPSFSSKVKRIQSKKIQSKKKNFRKSVDHFD